ncbi:MAG: hypothetical protein LBB11_04050 [Puniceicoccales bacterium]|nr:hypothetical protein [Puniceicoccales bacterium]
MNHFFSQAFIGFGTTVGGCRVHRLKRIQIGQLKLKNLAVGAIKYLTPSDRERLFS